MLAASRLRTSLSSATSVSYGAWQMLPGHSTARTIARLGVDWVLVDCEHGNIDDAAMHEAVSAIAAAGSSPVVRLPAGEGWMIKRALDSGAHGIMVPLVSTGVDARRVVSAAKFPPMGVRGFGSPFAPSSFGIDSGLQYLQEANDTLVTIVQIETQEGVDNVDEIAATDGIDVVFVGPFGLGNSLGFPITSATLHPTLAAAIEKVRVAADKAGKRSGIYCTSGAQAKSYVEKGFNMVSVAADVASIAAHMTNELKTAKAR